MINHQEAIKRMESVREYLCAGNPIWNVAEMREVFDMAISALQVQEAKIQLSAEGTTSDLISRQAAIDAIVNKVSGIGLHDNSEVARYGATFRQHEIIDIIESLPSVHSEIEERKEESAQNVPKEDLISRKAAIDAAESAFVRGVFPTVYIRELPSAQQETAKRIVGKSRDGMTLWYQCDMCNEPVDAQDDFCRGCGRRLTDG